MLNSIFSFKWLRWLEKTWLKKWLSFLQMNSHTTLKNIKVSCLICCTCIGIFKSNNSFILSMTYFFFQLVRCTVNIFPLKVQFRAIVIDIYKIAVSRSFIFTTWLVKLKCWLFIFPFNILHFQEIVIIMISKTVSLSFLLVEAVHIFLINLC